MGLFGGWGGKESMTGFWRVGKLSTIWDKICGVELVGGQRSIWRVRRKYFEEDGSKELLCGWGRRLRRGVFRG